MDVEGGIIYCETSMHQERGQSSGILLRGRNDLHTTHR